jgi:hypothetical protein
MIPVQVIDKLRIIEEVLRAEITPWVRQDLCLKLRARVAISDVEL